MPHVARYFSQRAYDTAFEPCFKKSKLDDSASWEKQSVAPQKAEAQSCVQSSAAFSDDKNNGSGKSNHGKAAAKDYFLSSSDFVPLSEPAKKVASEKRRHNFTPPKTEQQKSDHDSGAAFSATSSEFIGPLYQPPPQGVSAISNCKNTGKKQLAYKIKTVALGNSKRPLENNNEMDYELRQFYKELLQLEADDQNIGQTNAEDQTELEYRNAPPAQANIPPIQTSLPPPCNSFPSNSSALMPLHSHQNEKPVSPAKHPALPPDDYNTCNRLAPLRETSPVFVSQALPPRSFEGPPPCFVPQYGPPPPRFDYPLRFPQENNLLRPPFPENHQPNMVIDYHRPRTQPPRCNSPATPQSVFSPHGGNFTKPNIELAASFSQQEHPRGELLELEATDDQNICQTTSEDQLVHRCRNAPPAKANLPPFQTYPSPQYNSFSSNSSALMPLHSHQNEKPVSPAKHPALPPDDYNTCNRLAPLRETSPVFVSQALPPRSFESPPPCFVPQYGPPPPRFDYPLRFPQENNLLRPPFPENHQPNMVDYHRPRTQPPRCNSPATPQSVFSPHGGNFTKPNLELAASFSQQEHPRGELLELEATDDQNIGQTTSEDQLVHRCRNAPPAKANLPPFQTYPSPQCNSFSSNSSALMSLHSHRNDKAVSPAKPPALPPDDHNICNRVAPLRETRPYFLSQALSPAGVEDPAPPSFMPRYGPPPSRFDHPLRFPQENNLLRLPFPENHQPNMIDHHRPRAQPPFHNSPATPESMFSPQGGNYTKPHLEPPFNFSQREHHQGDLGGWRGRPVGELSLPRAANGPHEQYTHETHRFRDAAPCTYSAKKLVLLRGLPGSGKSTLACTLLSQARDGIVLSTDDYFCQENGYTYDVKLLGDAHTWNHNRARKAMDDGRSPIIIDNTNIQSWEMKPYVHMAMDHGYEVEFLEPNTWWKLDPSELEKRNTHRVPREKISQMLERFELNMTVGIVMNSVEPRHKRSNRPPPEARARWGGSLDCLAHNSSFHSR